ncbi:MAG: L-rhamnose isomerase [Bacillales bacterium]|jgi:L-rhamnose isomerase|nr:L-rhamnose isomerase [Bacillales bacterium]
MDSLVTKRFKEAKKIYESLGVDVNKALRTFKTIPVSLHCWAGDDIKGFEDLGDVHSENVVTGAYPYPAKTGDELRQDIEKAFSYSPLRHKVNLHSMYAERKSARNDLNIEDFRKWVDWAKVKGYGLDFNTSFFTHPMMDNGNSVTSLKKEVRDYWIKAGIDSRKISLAIGKELNWKCYNNFWFPDGMKDMPANKMLFRTLLKESLDKIFEYKFNKEERKYTADVLEGKLFGISTEAFVVGSHDFYIAYAVKNNIGVTMDLGHYNVGEVISDKISAVAPFVNDIMLHVSRGLHWDSDHVVIQDDQLFEIMREIKRADLWQKVAIGLDFFDSSINRIAEWAIGLRATAKAILASLLEPTELLYKAEQEGDYTRRLYLLDEVKNLPINDIWNYILETKGIAKGLEVIDGIKEYEEEVQAKR